MNATPSTKTSSGPDWVRDAIFYQIFPERFCNSMPALNPPGTERWGGAPTRDNFFGGDLPGVEKHLDHIEKLGANAIYFTPIFTAGTNHRYDTIDYMHVDPHLGGDESFSKLLEAAHGQDIRVVLDAVFHHCGIDHPRFKDVIANQDNSEYATWFHVEAFPVSHEPEPNYLTCSGCWYMPKLNVNNPALREYLYGVARHWIERGIDGWRLDVPYMLENPWFWRGFREQVKGIDPDRYIVAEVWEAATEWATGETSDGAMNYRLRDAILDFVTEWRGGGDKFAEDLAQIDSEIPADHKGLMLNLLGSHDTERLLTHCGGDVGAAKLAFGLLFTAEGAPMVYYGDEVGMTGFNDPGCRGCMDWSQQSWNTEILDWVSQLSRIRTANVALRRGSETTLQVSENTIVRERRHPEQTVLIAANRGDVRARCQLAPGYATDLVTGDSIDLGSIELESRAIRILRRDS